MSATSPRVADGMVVGLYYTLKDPTGRVIDTNRRGGRPLVYLHGRGALVKGLEKALVGKAKDDYLAVVVAPEEGYGVVDPGLVETIDRSKLPAGLAVRAGMSLAGTDAAGHRVAFVVSAVEGDAVTLDRNHPLAGKTLHFEVTVAAVRAATAEEAEHGHAHGAGGAHDH